jgi:hypothetical protein
MNDPQTQQNKNSEICTEGKAYIRVNEYYF